MSTAVLATPTRTKEERAGKYLAFHLGPEEFGIQVLKVREIMGIQEITAVPHTPLHTKGVINLRGKVIPVVDLRLKFGMPEVAYTQRTCIIVTEVEGESGPMMIGAVVDGVSEVLNLAVADIEDTPDFGGDVATTGLLGMAKVKGKVKILLDIDHVMTHQDLNELGKLLS
ncbi:MAG: chemotaxis protein CheW [Acidobacteria bacterium]|nr:chemotaxis protein CheW [Acidobacteriota bacterium]